MKLAIAHWPSNSNKQSETGDTRQSMNCIVTIFTVKECNCVRLISEPSNGGGKRSREFLDSVQLQVWCVTVIVSKNIYYFIKLVLFLP